MEAAVISDRAASPSFALDFESTPGEEGHGTLSHLPYAELHVQLQSERADEAKSEMRWTLDLELGRESE